MHRKDEGIDEGGQYLGENLTDLRSRFSASYPNFHETEKTNIETEKIQTTDNNCLVMRVSNLNAFEHFHVCRQTENQILCDDSWVGHFDRLSSVTTKSFPLQLCVNTQTVPSLDVFVS